MRRRLLLLIFAVASSGSALPAFAQLPQFLILTTPIASDGTTHNAECNRFWSDYNDRSTGLQAALKQHYDTRYRTIETGPIGTACQGISRLPTFVTPRRTIVGYTTPENLLAQLGIGPAGSPADHLNAVKDPAEAPRETRPADPQSGPAAPAAGPDVSELAGQVDRALSLLRRHGQDLGDLRSQISNAPTREEIDDHAKRLKWLYDAQQKLGSGHGDWLVKLEASQKKIAADVAILRPIAKQAVEAGPPASWWAPLVSGALKGLGIGGVPGALAGAAVSGAVSWFVTRGLKKAPAATAAAVRVARAIAVPAPSIPAAPFAPEPIVVEAPPPPQVVRTDVRTQTIEGPNHEAVAWQKAVDELRQREPGLSPLFDKLTSLKGQFLSGIPK